MKVCQYCGRQIPEGVTQCPYCHQRIASTAFKDTTSEPLKSTRIFGNISIISGVVLVIIGVSIIIPGIVVVPHATNRLENVPHSEVWLNESFEVPSFHYYFYQSLAPFWFERTLHITFDVIEGAINFRVMNETNFMKFNASQAYEYYVVSSRDSISSLDIKWLPPSSEILYFVWDNSDSFTAESVSAYFTFEWTELEYQQVIEEKTLLPFEIVYLGILLFIGGITIAGYGLSKYSFQGRQQPLSRFENQVTQSSSTAVPELKMRHIVLTVLFGFLYAVPVAILVFRNNQRAAKILLFISVIEIPIIWLALTLL